MKKITTTKLTIGAETIRQLTSQDLTGVAGGADTAFCPLTGTCSAACPSVGCTDKCGVSPTAGCTTHG